MRLTAITVPKVKLPAGKSDHVEWDDEITGLGLRLRAGGSKTLVFQYKHGTKTRRMVLGKIGAVNITEVRETAEKLYHRARLGQDPAFDRIEAKREASDTFLPSAKEFLTAKRELYRPSSYREIDRHLMLHAKPLHHLPVAKIVLSDTAKLIDAIAKQSGDPTANRVRSSLSVFFTWLCQRGRADSNPIVNVEKREEQSRDRVLTPSELRLIWNGLGDDNEFSKIIRLLALTGQRRSEISGLRWSEVHDNELIFSAERTKNGRDHVLPLSGIAAEIIAQQPKRNGRDMIFGVEGVFGGMSRYRRRLDERITAANGGEPIPHWTPHDLRRTFATYAGGGLPEHQLKKLPPQERELAAGLGIEPHVIEAVLNHVSGHKAGVAGIYNRATYPREKKTAMDLWAERLIAIVENRPTKVTPLRRGA